jgi:hypothetical protein
MVDKARGNRRRDGDSGGSGSPPMAERSTTLSLGELLHTAVSSIFLEQGILRERPGFALENWKIELCDKVHRRVVEHAGFLARCGTSGRPPTHFDRESQLLQEPDGTSYTG